MDHLVHRIVRCAAATITCRKPATLMNLSNANGGLLDAWGLCKAGISAGEDPASIIRDGGLSGS